MNGNQMKRIFPHAGAVGILMFFLCYNFFFIGNYAAYPWWHQSKNDIDPTNAGTTVGLLNNSELQYISHPGGTIYFLNGLAYRWLEHFDRQHKDLFALDKVKSLNDASDILETATRTSRILTLMITLVFAGVFYGVLYSLTGSPLWSFLFAFYALTSEACLMHTYMVRPEILSMLFVFLAAWLWIVALRNRTFSFKNLLSLAVATGFLMGFSVFSKIQSGPMILALIGVLAIVLFRKEQTAVFLTLNHSRAMLILAVLNFLIMPWWAFRRPAFMTPEYISRLKYSAHELLAYGLHPPENFYLLASAVLFAGLALAVFSFVVAREKSDTEIFPRMFPVATLLNGLVTGLSVSVYFILLPVSKTLGQYLENTRHLVYSVLTNILNAGIMQYKVLNGQTIPKIIEIHGLVSPVLNMNILIFVAMGTVVGLFRMARERNKQMEKYLAVLVVFAVGFVMDVLATMRGPKLYDYYACYSIVFYSAGLALLTVAELLRESLRFKKILGNIILAVLCLHVLYVTQSFLRQPRASGKSDQTPYQEYLNTHSLARPFWRIVDQSIKKNNNH